MASLTANSVVELKKNPKAIKTLIARAIDQAPFAYVDEYWERLYRATFNQASQEWTLERWYDDAWHSADWSDRTYTTGQIIDKLMEDAKSAEDNIAATLKQQREEWAHALNFPVGGCDQAKVDERERRNAESTAYWAKREEEEKAKKQAEIDAAVAAELARREAEKEKPADAAMTAEPEEAVTA